MKLNCKQGDLAVKIKADPKDEIPIGAIVKCIKYADGICAITDEKILGWDVEFRGSNRCPEGYPWFALDEYLRPIRDQDGEDETLTWAGNPQEVTA